jgi:hypothetical protein
METDGIFEEKARRAWKKAEEEWREFGDRDIPTTFDGIIHLNENEKFQQDSAAYVRQLDQLDPGLRDKLIREKRQALTDEQRQALDTPVEKRNQGQFKLAAEAEEKLKVSHEEVARRLQGAKRRQGLKLAKQAAEAENRARAIDRYRQIVNFLYWRRRAQVEQTPEALAAREALYEGRQAYAKGDLITARERYETGLAKWRQVLDKKEFAELKTDRTMVDDLSEAINHYRSILEKRDEEFPKNFILQDILDEAAKHPN